MGDESLGVTNYGVSGLINMPDARIAPDGDARGGLGFTRPYVPFFAAMTVLPRTEINFRYTRLMGDIPTGLPGTFGSYKDKAVDLKFVLVEESAWMPQLAVGAMDIHGTRLLPARYAVATKRIGDFDVTLGFGDQRLDGAFYGFRYNPAWAPGWRLTVEQDAFDYASDPFATDSGADQRDGGIAMALGYEGRGWGARISREDGELGARVYLNYPWSAAEFVPKTNEPPPLRSVQSDPQPAATWVADGRAYAELIHSLEQQDFGDIRLALQPDGTFEVKLNNRRITHTGRAVGRAARTVLLLGPSDIRGLRITYAMRDLPIVAYSFSDITVLRAYFAGQTSGADLAPTIKVTYPTPEAARQFADHELDLDHEELPAEETKIGNDPDYAFFTPTLPISRESREGSAFYIQPFNFGFLFNDPSGALKYEVFATAVHGRRLGEGLFAVGSLRLSLIENISDSTTTPNNSLLPHVRSDAALYADEGPLKLADALLIKYQQLDERLFVRYSAGFYDTMFAGAGTEVLWLPRTGNFAYAFTLEALRQRDYKGFLGLQDYSTVLALGSVYYNIRPLGVTLSARFGRVLAKDEGVRLQFSRQLRSGFRFGVWYTITNGNDITSPGSPSSPYRDKGVFFSMPLHAFSKKDTRGHAGVVLPAWNRDVGQVAQGPRLYELFQQPLHLNHEYYNPLSLFGL